MTGRWITALNRKPGMHGILLERASDLHVHLSERSAKQREELKVRCRATRMLTSFTTFSAKSRPPKRRNASAGGQKGTSILMKREPRRCEEKTECE